MADDVFRMKCDSIIINKDMMSLLKEEMVEEINQNVTNKFEIIDNRVDHLFQTLNRNNIRDGKKLKEVENKPKETENEIELITSILPMMILTVRNLAT